MSALIYTIPSIALFQLLVPFTGLDATTIEIALVAYTLVILFPNIVAGLRAAPPEVLEAARGMGLHAARCSSRVELPLARAGDHRRPADRRRLDDLDRDDRRVRSARTASATRSSTRSSCRRRSRPRSTRPALLAVALALACDAALVLLRRAARALGAGGPT